MGSSIKEISQKIKAWGGAVLADRELFPALLIVTVGVASFGLGRLSVEPEAAASPEGTQPAQVRMVASEEVESAESDSESATEDPAEEGSVGQFVGSQNSDKYHLPWCSGAKRIAEENKIWFATKAEAEAAGYVPAANCKGI